MPEYQVREHELQGLIFDCDGTLVDTMPAYWESWRRLTRQFGLNFNEKRFYSLAGTPVRDIIQMLVDEAHALDDSLGLDVDHILEVKKKYGSEAVVQVGTPKIQCVIDIAKKYHGKIPLAVASSGHREHVLFSLQSNGILELFDAVVTIEDVKNPKPHPEIFLEAAKRISCHPAKCRGFEDADIGMTSLMAAGMEAVDVRLMEGYPRVEPSHHSTLDDVDDHMPVMKTKKSKSLFMSVIHFLLGLVPYVLILLLFLKYCGDLLSEAIKEEALNDD
jgi:beta-phosphoglucomutase-like phosphatase (HAD superfamily)